MRSIKLFLPIFLLLFVGFLPVNEAQSLVGTPVKNAWSSLSKNAVVLADDEIKTLSQMIKKTDDVSDVKKIIGEKKLTPEAIEDAYTRIAISRGVIKRDEAEVMFKNLRGVEGFGSTMGKIIGMNRAGTRGHLNELRIANTAATRGYKVEGIGVQFDDGIKHGLTDLDVLISKNGKKFAIEAKDYADLTLADLSNTMRPDMDSLVAYKKMTPAPDNIHLVFTITNRPNDANVLKLMQKEAKKRDIELIDGSPEQQIFQIEKLLKILN